MNASLRPTIGQRNIGEALFALGLALPLFAGGNTLLALEPTKGVYVFDVVSIVVAGLLFIRSGTKATPRGSTLFANRCLLVLGLWWMGSLVCRPSGPRALLDAQGIFCGILLFTSLSRHTLLPDTMTRFLRGLLLGTLGTVAFSQYQYWIAFPRTAPLAQAAGIPVSILVNANFYNANCYAVFLAAVIVLAAQLAIANRDLLARAAIPIFVVTILLSESRSVVGLLAFGAVALGRFAGWRPRAGRSRIVAESLWVVVPAAAGVAAASVDLEELWRVATLGRLAIWRASVAMIRDHWLLGVGLGGFGDFFVDYRVNDYYTRYPHNFLLEIGAELGVVGLLALVGFLAAAFARPVAELVAAARQARPSFVPEPLLVICTAAAILLLHALLDIDWHAPANPILLFILLGAAQRLQTLSEGSRDA